VKFYESDLKEKLPLNTPRVFGCYFNQQDVARGRVEYFCIAMEDMKAHWNPVDSIEGMSFDDLAGSLPTITKLHATFWGHAVLKEEPWAFEGGSYRPWFDQWCCEWRDDPGMLYERLEKVLRRKPEIHKLVFTPSIRDTYEMSKCVALQHTAAHDSQHPAHRTQHSARQPDDRRFVLIF
jgi:hypothetical protein